MSATDLPPYTVRTSRQARHVRLTVTAREGLVVVVPSGMRVDANAVVAEKRAWASSALEKVAEKRALFAAGAEALLPHEVELRGSRERWPVEYVSAGSGVAHGSSGAVRGRVLGGSIVLSGDIDDADACLFALSRWLDRVARERLLPFLATVAADVGLTYASARVRKQRSRWGSCSSANTISLNRSLIFLPPELVRAIMLHELAHTLVRNHSPRFWATLERLDPDMRVHRSQMRAARDFVPAWADA